MKNKGLTVLIIIQIILAILWFKGLVVGSVALIPLFLVLAPIVLGLVVAIVVISVLFITMAAVLLILLIAGIFTSIKSAF